VGLALNQIVVLRSNAELEDAYRAIEGEKFVGFDTESKPTFAKGAAATGPHVIQLALQNRAFVVQLSEEPPLAFLKSVIESPVIVKVGFGLMSDREPLFRRLGIKLGAAVELTATLRALRYKHALGAKAAVAIVLGQRLQKSKSVTTSNWGSSILKPSQLLYAANDAYAALCVFRALGSPYASAESPTPNPSIERTSQRPLRALWPAAHVELQGLPRFVKQH
jgi:ribonuclease D